MRLPGVCWGGIDAEPRGIDAEPRGIDAEPGDVDAARNCAMSTEQQICNKKYLFELC